jgi:predicted porin
MAAIFQYESGVDLTGNGTGDGNGPGDNGIGGIFTRARDSFVGVKGNWGQVVFGRLGGLNQWVYDYNLFADQVGDLGNIWGGTGLPGRVNHVIQYATPNLGGFTGALTYTPDQGTNDSDAWVAKLNYGMAGFKVGGAYASFGQDAPLGIPLSDWKVRAITASYGSSLFSVGGGWQRETDILGLSGVDRTSYTVGGSFNTGDFGAFKVQYSRAGSIDPLPDSKGHQWAVGYDYNLFKSTTVYIAYARTSNGLLSPGYASYNYGHGDQGVPALGAGADPSALSVGLVYKFDASWGGSR